MKQHYDLVILNGRLADVIKEEFFVANIGISDGRIKIITKDRIDGDKKIDAEGLVVSPGFIDSHSHVDGNVYAAECVVRQGGTTTLGGERDLNSRIIRKIETEGFIINQGFCVSQSFVLRSAAGITDIHKEATRVEIEVMKDLARRFLEYGAFGICFGLELIPGVSKNELIEIAKVAKEFDRPIEIHMRKDGREALEHFDEIIEVAERTGVSIQILQLVYMVGIGGAMPYALEIIDAARERGLDIAADSGVYDAYTVCAGTGVFDEGWEKEYPDFSTDNLIVASGTYAGQRCDEELFHFLRKEYPATLLTASVCDPEAIMMALKKDYVFVSTNAADGPYYPGVGAPEAAGTFPRLLGRYVRERGEISLMNAIKKITIEPARRYGMDGSIGSLEEGKNADIVIFDADTIIDRAEFVHRGRPDAPPVGIEKVIVNGEIVVEGTRIVGSRTSGRFIKAEKVFCK